MSTYKSLSPTPTYMKCMFSTLSKAFSTTGIAAKKKEKYTTNNVANPSYHTGIKKTLAVKIFSTMKMTTTQVW